MNEVHTGAKKRTAELSAFQAFVLGAVTNAIATTICYPLEVIRMTQQSQGETDEEAEGSRGGESKGNRVAVTKNQGGGGGVAMVVRAMRHHAIAAWVVLRNILKQEGIAGWFKGLGPQLTASVLSSALMMMVKERIVGVSTKVLYLLLTGRAAPKKS